MPLAPGFLRIILLAGSLWFLAGSYLIFARKGMRTGTIVFVLAGAFLLFQALRPRKRGVR